MHSTQLISRESYEKFKGIFENGKKNCFPLLKPLEFKDIVLSKNTRSEYISNLPKRFNYSHSYSWGFLGTGPIDLSLSVLLHFTNEDLDFTYLHALDFMGEVIARLPMTDTVLKAETILDWIPKAKSRMNVEGFSDGFKPRPCPLGFIYHDGKLMQVLDQPQAEPVVQKTISQRRF